MKILCFPILRGQKNFAPGNGGGGGGGGGGGSCMAKNASKVVLNITRNFVHQYLSCKNNAETSCCRVGK